MAHVRQTRSLQGPKVASELRVGEEEIDNTFAELRRGGRCLVVGRVRAERTAGIRSVSELLAVVERAVGVDVQEAVRFHEWFELEVRLLRLTASGVAVEQQEEW